MIQALKRRLTIEISHFQALSTDTKMLLLSFSFYLATWPLFGTFINTFLWRETNNIITLLAYNSAYFIGLPLGFIVNGYAARLIKLKDLYSIGIIAHVIAPFITIFFAPSHLGHIFLLGLFFGLPSGIFWANKNFITLHLTQGHNRLYYNNIENIFDISVNTTLPFIIGWFIAITQSFTGSAMGYQITMLIAALFLLISTLIIRKVTFPTALKTTIFPRQVSRAWRLNRLAQTLYWLQEGLGFYLPTSILMLITNNEGIVGTIDSFAAVIAALTAYIIGRKTSAKNIPLLFFLGSLMYLITALGLTVHLSLSTVIMYSIVSGIGGIFRFTPYYSHLMDVMDREKNDNYSLVVDNEIFFNLGRVLSVVVFFTAIQFSSLEMAIRYVPLSLILIQFALLPLIRHIINLTIPPSVVEIARITTPHA